MRIQAQAQMNGLKSSVTPMSNNLLIKYEFAKTIVLDEGFQDEISWQSRLNYDDLDESSLLREIAWVILTCGMKELIIRNRFNSISHCFFNWSSAKKIKNNREECIQESLKIFNNFAKLSAIANSAIKIESVGFTQIKRDIKRNPLFALQEFDYIGPVTKYHLAKNIGLDVAKPDRHLVRIAKMENYPDVQTFCQAVSKLSGDSVPVVDLIYWRYATIERNYLDTLSSLNCKKMDSPNLDENYYNPFNESLEFYGGC